MEGAGCEGDSFFLCFLWCVMQAGLEVPAPDGELASDDGKLLEFAQAGCAAEGQ